MSARLKIVDLPERYQNQVAKLLYATHSPVGQVPDAKPEYHKAPALGRPVQGETESVSRTTVRFVGYRVKPLDPDNFAGGCKDLLDGLRHAKLISGDEPWRIIFETEQVKVDHFRDERTEITITCH